MIKAEGSLRRAGGMWRTSESNICSDKGELSVEANSCKSSKYLATRSASGCYSPYGEWTRRLSLL